MNVTSCVRGITVDVVVTGTEVPEQPSLTDFAANLVIETLDEFDGGVYTTSTGADYLNSSAAYN